ncbi:MAG: hypothetical protein ACK4ZJ_18575, partial [Allorhizobium sp.]
MLDLGSITLRSFRRPGARAGDAVEDVLSADVRAMHLTATGEAAKIVEDIDWRLNCISFPDPPPSGGAAVLPPRPRT